ncbi:MAG: methylated-DNA--[protein]-cysteine S-methyltransferase [Mariprofundaceae bacterium]|nr:methylated-DNA--[protein]-cysteine S-methyltransferase [Mariprofundaceae bacterium]
MSVETHLFRYESPLGPVGLELTGNVCHRITLGAIRAPECSPDHPVALWLRAYFMGQILPLPEIAPPKTPFQQKLREGLLNIPAGKTCSYGELARRLHSGARAVGQALGANPLPILIPCHRVVAANGPGGFAYGEEWKRKLLTWEASIQAAI